MGVVPVWALGGSWRDNYIDATAHKIDKDIQTYLRQDEISC
jgi:hypothetical protein